LSVYFVDTSAIAKRYLVMEKGASWVASWAPSLTGNIIVLAELTIVEMSSVLARKVEDKSMAQVDATRLKGQFLSHVRTEYLVFPLNTSLLSRASHLVTAHYRLRALDSIQLAAALEAQSDLNEPMIFISADNRLLSVAAQEGLQVDNPELHP